MPLLRAASTAVKMSFVEKRDLLVTSAIGADDGLQQRPELWLAMEGERIDNREELRTRE